MRSARRHELLWHSPDILCGAAGYGMAYTFWAAGLGEEFLNDGARVGDHLLNSHVQTADGVHWPDAYGEIPIGYAYGGSGIALFLLYLHLATGEPELHGSGDKLWTSGLTARCLVGRGVRWLSGGRHR